MFGNVQATRRPYEVRKGKRDAINKEEQRNQKSSQNNLNKS